MVCNTMVYMVQRTQLMLDRELKEDLLYLSQATNQSMSALVRTMLRQSVKEKKKGLKRVKKINPAQALLDLAKKIEKIEQKHPSSYPTDWSLNHDYYLYGAPKIKP